jgi:glutathione S-transferase
LCQSGAITRYLAKVAKLYPEDIRVASMAEMYLEGITEWRNKAYSIWFANDATEQSMDQYLTITVPFYLSVFEKAINENGYLSGDTLSFVDLALWDILKENKYETIYQSDKYPKLNQHYKMIGSLDKVEAYMNSTKRPPSIDEFLNGLN